MVRVTVGKDDKAKTFAVHKVLLCYYSGYFNAALNGSFEEAEKDTVSLPTEDPQIFECFMHWVYTRRFTASTNDTESLCPNTMIQLWIFGEAHAVPLCQNEAIGTIRNLIVEFWQDHTQAIADVYEHTSASAPLRRFLVDFVAHTGHAEINLAMPEAEAWPRELLVDLLHATWRKNGKCPRASRTEIERWNMCRYHVHEEGVKCPREN